MSKIDELVASLEEDGFVDVKPGRLRIVSWDGPPEPGCFLCAAPFGKGAVVLETNHRSSRQYVCVDRIACKARAAEPKNDRLREVEEKVTL